MLVQLHVPARKAVVAGVALVTMVTSALGVEVAASAELARQSLELLHRGEDTPIANVQLALYQQGLALAEKAVELNPNNADAHYATFANLGRIMAMQGAVANLLNAFKLNRSLKRALEVDPNHVGALIGRGSMYRELPRWLGGSLEKAEADFNRALTLDPNAISARLGLARVYLKSGRTPEAITLLTESHEMAIARKTRRYQLEAESLLGEVR